MTKQKRYILHEFPITIEPLVGSLEARVELIGSAKAGKHWCHLDRLKIRPDSLPFTMANSMVHFFGPEKKVEECPFMLVYDSLGLIRFRMDRVGPNDIDVYQIPPEMNGNVSVGPSVRLSFNDAGDAECCADLVDRLRDGQANQDDFSMLKKLLKRTTDSAVSFVASRRSNVDRTT